MAFLDPVLNPVLQPLLNYSPLWTIFILALAISVIMVLAYKLLTNQSEMKRLKGEQKDYQKKMKGMRDQPEEMMKVQKQAMKKNMEYMKQSFKPTLITMIPLLLLFGWMSAHLAFEPIYPGETYSITAEFSDAVSEKEAMLLGDEGTEIVSEPSQAITSAVTWNLKSTEGEHFVTVMVNGDQQTKRVLISEKQQYEEPLAKFDHSDIELIKVNYKKLTPLGDFSVPIINWKPGWLGLYIILSIVFSIVLRKVFNVY